MTHYAARRRSHHRRRVPSKYTKPLSGLQESPKGAVNKSFWRLYGTEAMGRFVLRRGSYAPIGRHLTRRICRSADAAEGHSNSPRRATKIGPQTSASPPPTQKPGSLDTKILLLAAPIAEAVHFFARLSVYGIEFRYGPHYCNRNSELRNFNFVRLLIVPVFQPITM